MKDLGFLWSKTVNLRKRSIGEPLRIKGIASTRRGKYWKNCNEMHNHFGTSDAFLQRWKLEYDCQNVEAKSALIHSSVNPDYLQWLEGHFSFIRPSGCSRACSQTNLSPGLPELPSYISSNQEKHSGEPASKDDERVPWHWDSFKKVQTCKTFIIWQKKLLTQLKWQSGAIHL